MATHLCTKLAQVASKKLAIRCVTRGIRSCAPLLEKKDIRVPTMGDSITEGTIVEWPAAVGQAVSEGDVVALVETDKVTIDIKAEIDGVITAHYGEVDDNVEVGANLYQIDTEGTATITADSVEEGHGKEEVLESADTPVEIITATDSTMKVRVPSIHFLGKAGWMKKLSVSGESSHVPDVSKLKPHHTNVLDGSSISPMYGRLPFSEREMEALIMGGASETEFL